MRQLFYVAFVLFAFQSAKAQVAISTSSGTTAPDPSAVLLLVGDGKQGLIIPTITPTVAGKPGMIGYSAGQLYYCNASSAWVSVVSGGGGSQSISINGNLVQLSGSVGSSFGLASNFPTSPQLGLLLMWNGSTWEATTNTLPVNGNVLMWNSTTNKWEPKPIAGGGDLLSANNLSELTNKPTARTNLGLAALATLGSVSGGTGGTITDLTIDNNDIATNAAIDGTKISPTFTSNLSAPSLKLTSGSTSINGLAYTWPTVAPVANTFLKSDASGNLSWTAGGSGFSSLNAIPKGDGSALVASSITDDGTTVEITTTSPKLSLRSTSGVSTTAASSLEFTNALSGLVGSISDTGSSDHLQISSFAQGLLFNTNFNTRMAIDNNGNVGIGTISPISKLDVSGDLRLAPITAPGVTAEKLYNVSGSLFWNGTNISSGGSGWGLTGNASSATDFIGTTNTQPLRFATGTGSIERMRIDGSSGNVGIGTTSPMQPLHIAMPAPSSGTRSGIRLTNGNTSGSAPGSNGFEMSIGNTGLNPTSGYLWNWDFGQVYLGSNNRQHIMLNGNSNVLIGDANTPGAQEKLHINESTSNPVYLKMTNSGANDGLSIGIDGSKNANIFNLENASMKFQTNALDRMIIDAAGNVGIGTTFPSEKLSVAGGSDNGVYIGGFSGFVGSASARLVIQAQSGFFISPGMAPEWTIGSFTSTSSNLDILRRTDSSVSPTGEYTFSSTAFSPYFDNGNTLGTSTKRWTSVFAVNGVINTSDFRLKENIKNLGYGLNEVLKLRPVSYSWKDGTKTTKLGLIAQETELVLPEVVSKPTEKDDHYGIMYSDLIPVLIKAIQEQQKTIDTLSEQNKALKEKELKFEASLVKQEGEMTTLKKQMEEIMRIVGAEAKKKR